MSGFTKYVKQGVGIAIGMIIVGTIIGIGLTTVTMVKREAFNSEVRKLEEQRIKEDGYKKYGKLIGEPTTIEKGGKYEITYDSGTQEAYINNSIGRLIKSINKGESMVLSLSDNWSIDLQPGTLIRIKIIEE